MQLSIKIIRTKKFSTISLNFLIRINEYWNMLLIQSNMEVTFFLFEHRFRFKDSSFYYNMFISVYLERRERDKKTNNFMILNEQLESERERDTHRQR